MGTVADVKTIDLIDHEELLLLFHEYVLRCIEDSKPRSPVRPASFDEWYEIDYLKNIDSNTVVISVKLNWEEAAGGYLCGSRSKNYRLRVPAGSLTDDGAIVDNAGLRRVCRKFVNKMGHRLSSVAYRDKLLYHWTWS
jgi:hypothetical protein